MQVQFIRQVHGFVKLPGQRYSEVNDKEALFNVAIIQTGYGEW